MACILGGYIYGLTGARYGLVCMCILTVIGSAFLIYYQDNENALPYFVILTKFGPSAANTMVYISNVDLIPVMLSTTVFGFWNVIVRIINSMSSLFAEMEEPTPMIVNISVSIACGLCALLLVEKLPTFK